MHRKLTTIFKNLSLGENFYYKSSESFFEEFDQIWKCMENYAPAKERYLVYGIDTLPQKKIWCSPAENKNSNKTFRYETKVGKDIQELAKV